MSEISEDNLKVLIEIKNKLQEVCKDRKYQFADPENLHDMKTRMMDIIKQSYNGGHITREINKTEMPDECILFMMRNEGYGITSIDDLAEVTQEWSYDNDNKILKLSTKPMFKLKHTRVILTITPTSRESNHNWIKNSDGSIADFQVGEEDYHTGPICTICGFSFCQHCNEDGWNDNSCTGPTDGSINGGFFLGKDSGIRDKTGKYVIGTLEKIPITANSDSFEEVNQWAGYDAFKKTYVKD